MGPGVVFVQSPERGPAYSYIHHFVYLFLFELKAGSALGITARYAPTPGDMEAKGT